MKKLNILIYLIIGTVILLSFWFFSSIFYPLFNADEGVIILMLHDFQLPRDLYFWGQNRYGSIVPLLGQVFYKGFGLSSLWSESLCHYLILILGYLSFSSLLKSKFNKVILAILWFFPLFQFHNGLLRNVFGLQYSLLGMGIYLINRYSIKEDDLFNKLIIQTMLFVVFVTSVWVSDASIVTIFIIISILAFFAYLKNKNVKYWISRLETIYTAISVVLGTVIIFYLKANAITNTYDTYYYQIFNSSAEVFVSIRIIVSRLAGILSFSTSNPLISIYAYCVVLLLFSLPFLKIKFDNIGKGNRKWIFIFAMDGVVVFFIGLIAHWVFVNELGERYFTGLYISFWLAFLIYTERVKIMPSKYMFQLLILVTVMIGSLSTIYNFKYVFPKRLSPQSSIVSEFEHLGKIGIIADYWYSYGISFINPDLITATPHDKDHIRNCNLVDSVFAQPHLYLIKDMWLDSFPETIDQFGRKLIRKGVSFDMSGYRVNEYEEEVLKLTYRIEQLKYTMGRVQYDSVENNNFFKVDGFCLECVNKYVVFGPFINISEGRYKVSFRLKIDKTESRKDFAVLEVAADYGQKVLVKKNLNPSTFHQFENYENIELEFIIKKPLSNIELRIYNLGGVNLYFDSVEIKSDE